jgi:hypothetical protein
MVPVRTHAHLLAGLAAHSALGPAAAGAAALLARSPRLAASRAFQLACDAPVHHTAARPHVAWPLLDWRCRAPLSAWDRRHHARLVTAAETVLAAAAVACLVKGHPRVDRG